MAKVADRFIVWHSDPEMDEEGNVRLKKIRGVALEEPDIIRLEIPIDGTVPDTIPEEVQLEWEQAGWVHEDSNRPRIAKQVSAPRVLMPPVAAQSMAHLKTAGSVRAIPPRPAQSST
jgi:hypothetical protein